MTLRDVVPVTVPLDSSDPRPVTIPADTHLLYWCRISPVVPAVGLPDHEHQQIRARIFRALIDGVSAQLTVNGEPVGLVSEVIRPDGVIDQGFWNITEPLSPGFHDVTFALIGGQESNQTPPPCATYPSGTPVHWAEGNTIEIDIEIAVIDSDSDQFEAACDPFWQRREVLLPRRNVLAGSINEV